MANNLISDVMRMATPAIVDRIAAAIGVNADIVRNVLASAVPAIFAGTAAQAQSPGGLSNILKSLTSANPNITDALNSLSGGGSSPVVSGGTSLLRGVLGDGTLNTIINAVTKNTGASAAAGTSLVAIAGQMAMSALAKQAGGMDAAGLGNLLASQSSLFQSSLPASLANALGSAGAMASGAAGAAKSAASSATAAAGSAAAGARDAARSAGNVANTAANQAAAAASGGTNWLMWLIPLIIIAAALWYFLGHRQAATTTEATPPATQTTTTTTTTTPAAPTAIMVDNVDVTKTLGDSLTGLTAALGGITDAASAQAAVAKLQDAGKGIGTISGLAAKFAPDQKTAVAAAVNAGLPALKALVAKVEAMPGVGDVVKPVADPIVAQLDALSK